MLPDLTTPRLVLRELAPVDAVALQLLHDARRDDPGRSMIGDIEDQAARIANYERYRGPDEMRRIMAFVAFHDGAMIGTVSLDRPRQARIGGIGVFVGDAHQGRGLGTELVARMLRFGFEDCDMHRIEADVEVSNIASQRVMKRVGMVREGVMRDCTFAGGRWWSDAKYAILASDWLVRGSELQSPSGRYWGGLR